MRQEGRVRDARTIKSRRRGRAPADQTGKRSVPAPLGVCFAPLATTSPQRRVLVRCVGVVRRRRARLWPRRSQEGAARARSVRGPDRAALAQPAVRLRLVALRLAIGRRAAQLPLRARASFQLKPRRSRVAIARSERGTTRTGDAQEPMRAIRERGKRAAAQRTNPWPCLESE